MPEMPALPPTLERALTRAIARWVPPLTGIDAADLRQEALLAWWQVTQRYDATRGVPVAAYAWPRVLGRVEDVRRQATPHSRRKGAYVEYVPLGRDPTHTPAVREVWLWKVVNRLPARERYVIIRRYRSDWQIKQIARHLGVSPRRVDALHRTALRKLRLTCVLDLLEVGA